MSAITNSRRKFLTALGIGGAAAAAAVVVPKSAQAPQAGATVAASQAGGYRVTEHVLKYYHTTKV